MNWREGVRLFLDFLFPSQCVGCRRFVAHRILWCSACDCARSTPPAREINGVTVFGAAYFKSREIKNAIHALKYEMQFPVAHVLGGWMADALPEESDRVFVPIPLAPERYALRGFNQSELLARRIADLRGGSVSLVLEYHGVGGQQAKRSRAQRIDAMQNAFYVAGPLDPKKHYCIVDDVLTTGSTMAAAIDALRSAGAVYISAMVVAVA